MTKITIFGLLAVIETPDKPGGEEKPAPPPTGKRPPTLDELFAHACAPSACAPGAFRDEPPPSEEPRRDRYGTIFTQ